MKRPRNKLKETVHDYLLGHELARERRNRYKALQGLLCRIYPDFQSLPQELRERICDTCVACDRYIRKCQEENVELRGGDYGEGTALSQQWQLD